MARFYVSAQGSRGEATRCGAAGITAHPRGWNTGVRVTARPDSDRFDHFAVSITGGSNGGREVPALHVVEQPDGERIVTVNLPGRQSVAVRYTADWTEIPPGVVVARDTDPGEITTYALEITAPGITAECRGADCEEHYVVRDGGRWVRAFHNETDARDFAADSEPACVFCDGRPHDPRASHFARSPEVAS